MSISIIIRI